MTDAGVVQIRGKEYQTVALRIHTFREKHPEWSLTSSIVESGQDRVVVEATIADSDGRIVANGHAEERRGSSQINKTSALENCETSAIGRALACLGFGGQEFASANEVQNAIHQQDAKPQKKARVKLDGPHTSKTALWTAYRAFDRELRACGDIDQYQAFLDLDDSKALIKQCERDAPGLLHGSDDMPAEFEPFYELDSKLRTDLAAATVAAG